MPRTRRQSRRQSDYIDAVDDSPPDDVADAPTNFSAKDMADLMASMQRSQTEAFERLLDRVLEHRPSTSPPAWTSSPASVLAHTGNFSKCTARYSGALGESLDAFIDAVEAFKDCVGVTDANALRGFSMLLIGDAGIWWQGVKATTLDWEDALNSLRCAFGDRRQPHRIYKELFAAPQGNERTDIFIARSRALLARLPPEDLTEKVQIDMIYGLLHAKIRERLRREEVSSFSILLRKVRDIEDATDGNLISSSTPIRSRVPPPAVRAPPLPPANGSTPSRAPPPAPPPKPKQPVDNRAAPTPPAPPRDFDRTRQTNVTAGPSKGPYCVYCKQRGHTREECPKLASKVNPGGSNKYADNENVVPTCYGCNTVGVTRSQCTKCNAVFSAVDFAAAAASTDSTRSDKKTDNAAVQSTARYIGKGDSQSRGSAGAVGMECGVAAGAAGAGGFPAPPARAPHPALSPTERSPAKSGLHVNFSDKGEVKERREKFLTAKYGSHQMALIRKRLAVEMWLYDELQKLYDAPAPAPAPPHLPAPAPKEGSGSQEVEVDIDELLDMEGDEPRRHHLAALLADAKKPQKDVHKFINELLEKAKTL